MFYESRTRNFLINLLTRLLRNLFCSPLKLAAVLLIMGTVESAGKSTSAKKWVGTWSTAPQLVEPGNNPPSPGLSNNTIRQIVHVSIGGDSLRMRFTNEFSNSPVKMNSVHIAVSKESGSVDTTTDRPIYFNGKPDTTIAPGAAVISDPFQFALQPLSDVAITIYFGETSPDISGHPGSRTTSYILIGNQVTKANFSGAVTTDHWYIINTIDVLASDSTYAVAILGNSITDGRGSGTNKQNRWPDEFARRLQANPATQHVSVLNEGIGGNAVLKGGLGPTALNRFQRDVLDQNGVKWLIIFEGINDIGGAWSSAVGDNLINAYKQMINDAHAKGIIVYGATLLPMKGNGYYSALHESIRQTVNNWIRTGGQFDAVIDLDKVMRNPADTLSLIPIGDSGDHLHPSEAGHHMMAEAVDLTLFSEGLSTGMNERPGIQPNTFSLEQNYPNPFNPTTVIGYQLPVTGNVSLKVHDILGKEVATLVNGDEVAGKYNVQLSTNDYQLPSGVYFYTLQTGNFIQSKKMIVLK